MIDRNYFIQLLILLPFALHATSEYAKSIRVEDYYFNQQFVGQTTHPQSKSRNKISGIPAPKAYPLKKNMSFELEQILDEKELLSSIQRKTFFNFMNCISIDQVDQFKENIDLIKKDYIIFDNAFKILEESLPEALDGSSKEILIARIAFLVMIVYAADMIH